MVEELEAVVNANVQRATRLRQSILQRAFEANEVQLEVPGDRIIEDPRYRRMIQLNAFVGHSFAAEDYVIVEAFLKYFTQIKNMDIGFAWETAEGAEPKDLAEKVKRVIADKNLFIGICTKRETAVDVAHLSKWWFRKKILKAPEERFVIGKPLTGSYKRLD